MVKRFNDYSKANGARMDAKEFLVLAGAAVLAERRAVRILESMRERDERRAAMSNMHVCDRGIDRKREEIERYRDTIDDALAVLGSMREVAPGKLRRCADVLEYRYIEHMDWKSIAHAVGMSMSSVKGDINDGIRWLNENGAIGKKPE